jgi:hypothetical protein
MPCILVGNVVCTAAAIHIDISWQLARTGVGAMREGRKIGEHVALGECSRRALGEKNSRALRVFMSI